MSQHFDIWSLVIIVITLVLFVMALLSKGFTHDLFLEAGVFLVSVKLIIMAYKSSNVNQSIIKELRDIKALMEKQSH